MKDVKLRNTGVRFNVTGRKQAEKTMTQRGKLGISKLAMKEGITSLHKSFKYTAEILGRMLNSYICLAVQE